MIGSVIPLQLQTLQSIKLMAALFELEEPSLVYDLREHFGGR